MKRNYAISYAAASLTALLLGACAAEAPFESEGEGVVSFATELHSDVELTSRALDSQTKQALEDNLTIYIESSKGVIRKYKGKNDLPSSLTLNVGEYAIEGWTGDSVSASYDKKFYRGYQNFTVEPGKDNLVKFNVNIANVIVSVDPETLNQDFQDFKVTFSHSRGLLEFDRQNVTEGKKGYFMMPNADKDIYYQVELKNQLGDDIVKDGYIENVERAHEYSIRILTQEPENDKGAGQVKLEILDIPVLDKSLNVYPAPIYYAQLGENKEDFDIVNTQVDFSEGFCKDLRLRVVGYGSLSRLALNFPAPFTGLETVNGVNLRNNDDAKSAAVASLAEHNISYGLEEHEGFVGDDSGKMHFQEVWITFSADFFNNLPQIPEEYVIEVAATDGMDYPASSSLKIRIANHPDAVDKRLVETLNAPDTYDAIEPMAILAKSATVRMKVNDVLAFNYGIEYRKKNSNEEFIQVIPTVQSQSLQTVAIEIKGLEPDTEYEYRGFCEGYTEQHIKTFKTEQPFVIPNASMESWQTINSTVTGAKNVPVPTDNGTVSFWDTGNHGSMSVAMMTAILTEGSSAIYHSGNQSAKLHSEFVGLGTLGKFAAGNIFTGYFAGVDGTDGILQLGRIYNESHPSALNVYVNYRPGTVASNVASKTDHFKTGDKDKAQIYIALTTEPFEVRTKNQARLFDENDDTVLAYGQVTIEDNVGDGNQMDLITIPFEYKSAARSIAPKYLVVVCAASKFGDYFVGGENSTMYVDDFSLEYNDLKWK